MLHFIFITESSDRELIDVQKLNFPINLFVLYYINLRKLQNKY